jgi:MFS family permease
VLSIPAFRRLWLAQLGSQLGEAIALVAMPLFVYGLTGSAELLSLIFILQLLPRVVLAPIAGMLADRLDRRRIVLGADLARAGLVALLPFTDRTWQIALLAMLVAVGNASLARLSWPPCLWSCQRASSCRRYLFPRWRPASSASSARPSPRV